MTDSTVWVRLGAALDRSPDAHRVELNRETAEAMLAEHAALRAENERLRAALEEHKKAKPDWYWRDLDPDDAGDTIGEALRFMPDNVVCAIRSSFVGPTFFAARVPVLDPESDDTEELCADNEADCLLLVKDRLKARAALAGGQHE